MVFYAAHVTNATCESPRNLHVSRTIVCVAIKDRCHIFWSGFHNRSLARAMSASVFAGTPQSSGRSPGGSPRPAGVLQGVGRGLDHPLPAVVGAGPTRITRIIGGNSTPIRLDPAGDRFRKIRPRKCPLSGAANGTCLWPGPGPQDNALYLPVRFGRLGRRPDPPDVRAQPATGVASISVAEGHMGRLHQ